MSSSTQTGSATRRTAPAGLAFATAVAAFAIVMAGTTLPTPLYSTYASKLGFGVVTTTVIYAVYAVGVILALLVFGRWSDVVGRRPLLIGGAVLSVLSAIAFVTAGPEWQLIAGRVLSGLSAGIYLGTATAAVIELAPARLRAHAPAIATAANIGGLGLGPLVAGLLAEYLPQPLRAPFALDLVLAAVAVVGLWFIPEPVDVTPGARPRMERLSVPPEVRATFVRAAIATFAGFAVLGTFTSVAPSFVAEIIGIHNNAVAGVLAATIFVVSALTQIVTRPVPVGHALISGCALLAVGVVALIGGLYGSSLTLLFVGGICCGVGQGMSFSKGLTAVISESPAARRAEVMSTYFVIAYIALSVPIVCEGLVSTQVGLRTAGVAFNAIVGVLALIALALTVIAHRRDRRATRT